MNNELTPKQRLIFKAIEDYWQNNSVPPSITDLASILQISKATAYEHLMALKRKGFLAHVEGAGRTWRPIRQENQKHLPSKIPLLGRVAAGLPILAAENIEDWLTVEIKKPHDTLFALRVQGQSMIEAHILHNDIVITRQQEDANNGDIVVALIDGEVATVKQLQKRRHHISLVAMNPDYEPLDLSPERVQILGKVIEVRRHIA